MSGETSDLPLTVPPEPDQVEVSLFGPGYGEAIAVHLGLGRWILVDSCVDKAGDPASISYLRSIGLDPGQSVVAVVATHWHDDHIRGLSEVFEACTQATFHCSAALSADEFSALTNLPARPSRFTSGFREIQGVIAEADRRGGSAKALGHLSAGNRLRLYSDAAVSEIWALSPSNEDINISQQEIARLVTDVAQRFSRAQIKKNDSSVALYLKSEHGDVLLGADLEHAANYRERGWHAVLDHNGRPDFKATLVKSAHHGSVTGYCPEVVEHLVSDKPVTILTPWELGGTKLPALADRKRIKAESSRAYITTDALTKPPNLSNTVEKTIKENTRNYTPLRMVTGHIQVRSDFGKWVVRLSPEASQL